jgi:predicted RecA/RadA family phage recombinase
VIGALFGVASKTAAAGETVTIATVEVYELPKRVSAVVAAGDRVARDGVAKKVVLAGTGRYPVGTAIEAGRQRRNHPARAAGWRSDGG